jgi:hypothetical protein
MIWLPCQATFSGVVDTVETEMMKPVTLRKETGYDKVIKGTVSQDLDGLNYYAFIA